MSQSESLNIILASASPRRRELLSLLGVPFTVMSADADESSDITEPELLTVHLARLKARAVAEQLGLSDDDERTVIISADTVVACDGKILGKPRDEREARQMLSLLSGRVHTVATGIAVTYRGVTHTDCSVTAVYVDNIPEGEIERYIESGEPFDKAGGYGIQGSFSRWISKLDGCYFGVVGLPVNLLCKLFYAATGKQL